MIKICLIALVATPSIPMPKSIDPSGYAKLAGRGHLLDTSARRGISPSPHLAEDLPRDGQPAAMATADRGDRGRAEARDAKDCCLDASLGRPSRQGGGLCRC
jgi:hypothetical protein